MKRVLIVDDDVQSVDILKNILESNGFDVVFSYDVEKTHSLALECQPDLIVLDISFAGCDVNVSDGIEMSRILKSDDVLKVIPILIVSGIRIITKNEKDFFPDDEWMPVDAFLDKPVVPNVFLKMVNDLIGGKIR
jgi:CheY-like chemotaxis protein